MSNSGTRVIIMPELHPLVFGGYLFATIDLSLPHEPQRFWFGIDQAPARIANASFLRIAAAAQRRMPSGMGTMEYADIEHEFPVCGVLETEGILDLDPTDLCAILAAMLTEQADGRDGALLTDGRTTLFPCARQLVWTHWNFVIRRWSIGVLGIADVVSIGRRVYSGRMKY